MVSVTTRTGKGAELTWAELDANFTAMAAAVNFLMPQDTAFATTVPLDGNLYMPQTNVTTNLTFTPAASPQKGAQSYLRLVANGANTVTFSGFKEWGGSIGYDNRNGILNEIQFFHDGVDSWYSISQAVGEVAADTTAPTISSASVANATPTTVTLAASETLNSAYVPAASAFTVSGHTVNAVSISGSTITLTVAEPFVNGEAARAVAYTQPGTNNVRDTSGNLLANFTGLAITNNVAPTDVTAPTLISATVNGTSLVLTYSETLQTALPAMSSWSVVGAGGTTQAPSAVAIPGSAVTLTLATPAVNGNTVTISYTVPGTNPIRDAAGNTAAALSGQAVMNNTPAATTWARLGLLNNTTESGTGPYTYTGTSGAGWSGSIARGGVCTQKLASGQDGWLQMRVGTRGGGGENFMIVDASATLVPYAQLDYGVFVKSNYTPWTNGAGGAASSTPCAVGDLVRMERVGTNLYAKVSKDSGSTWTTVGTWSSVPTGNLYFHVLNNFSAAVDNLTSGGLV